MKPILSMLLVLSALMLPSTLLAQTAPKAKAVAKAKVKTYKVPDTDVTVKLPTSWKIKQSKTSLDAAHPKVQVALSMTGFAARDMETALKVMESEFKKRFKNMKPVGEPIEASVNGMPTIMGGFETTVEGNKLEVMIIVSLSPGQKAAVIIAVAGGDASKDKQAADEMASILESINNTTKPGTGGIRPMPKEAPAAKSAPK